MRFVWPCLDDSDDIRDLQWRIKCPSNFRPPRWILNIQSRPSSHFCPDQDHICMLTWTDAVAFRLCVCGGRGGEYILSLVTLALAESCICVGKHTFGLHTINKSWESKIIRISTHSAFFISFSNIYSSKAWFIQGLPDSFHISLIHLLSYVMFTWAIYMSNPHILMN